MSQVTICDGCKKITSEPTLRLERVDGFGGDGIPISGDHPWDLCRNCSRRVCRFPAEQPPGSGA